MMYLFIRPLHLLCAAAICLLLAAAATGQESAADSATDAPAAKSTDAAPAADSASEEPAAPPSSDAPKDPPPQNAATEGPSAAAAFSAKLEEWKGLLGKMREVRTEYDAADEGDLAPIVKRWNDMLAAGEKLIDDLRATGAVAFAAAPNEDRELTRFLVKILEDDFARDSYENAAQLSQALLDNGYDNIDALNMGAVSAFNTNNYDKADEYLALAKSRGQLTSGAQQVAGLIDEYRGYWTAEQEIRKKEAAADDLPRVKITTNKGEMVAELFEDQAPGAVGNFVSLIEKEFYDGLTFHRVIGSFMAQGGCPDGNGTGGPGYEIFCEIDKDDYRRHFRGTLSMAHSGKDTGGSQFFMTFVPTAHLNGKHTGFGRIVEGLDVLDKLQRTEGEENEKAIPDRIVKIEVLRKREHAYEPDKVQ